MLKGSRISIFLLLAFMLTATASSGFDVLEKNTTYGFNAGLYSPGEVWVEGTSFDGDMSFGLSGFMDYKLGPKISGGGILSLNSFGANDESAMMMEIGFTLKAWINNDDSNLLFRPGFGLSYGMLGEIGSLESSQYFVIHGGVELVLLNENNMNWTFMLGISGAPTGGNDDNEMTYGPGLLLRAGLVF